MPCRRPLAGSFSYRADSCVREPIPADHWASLMARSGVGWASFGPVDHQLALGKQPRAVGLPGELIQIADVRDHQGALAISVVQVMGDRVRLARGPVSVEHYRALPVEIHRCLVRIQVVEN